MSVGDLVNVHWGMSDRSGEEDVDWGITSGIITEEIRWWDESEPHVYPCGDVNVFIHGEITSYNIGRCEVIV